MKNLHMVAWILVIVGGLNWLLIGLGGFMASNWNVVGMIFGSWPQVEWIVYILVGLSAVYELVPQGGNCRSGVWGGALYFFQPLLSAPAARGGAVCCARAIFAR